MIIYNDLKKFLNNTDKSNKMYKYYFYNYFIIRNSTMLKCVNNVKNPLVFLKKETNDIQRPKVYIEKIKIKREEHNCCLNNNSFCTMNIINFTKYKLD